MLKESRKPGCCVKPTRPTASQTAPLSTMQYAPRLSPPPSLACVSSSASASAFRCALAASEFVCAERMLVQEDTPWTAVLGADALAVSTIGAGDGRTKGTAHRLRHATVSKELHWN